MHTHGPRGKGLGASKSSYLDLNAIARVDVNAVCAVQETRGAAGRAPQVWRLHVPFTLRDVVITQN